MQKFATLYVPNICPSPLLPLLGFGLVQEILSYIFGFLCCSCGVLAWHRGPPTHLNHSFQLKSNVFGSSVVFLTYSDLGLGIALLILNLLFDSGSKRFSKFRKFRNTELCFSKIKKKVHISHTHTHKKKNKKCFRNRSCLRDTYNEQS